MAKVIGWDVETHLFEPGNLTPKMVCLSASGGADTLPVAQEWWRGIPPEWRGAKALFTPDAFGTGEWKLLASADLAADFMSLAVSEADVVVAHNGSYDWGVLCNEHPWLLPIFVGLVEEGHVSCTKVREMLLCIAHDNFKFDRRTRSVPKFSLAYAVKVYFGVDLSSTKSGGDVWRLRYSELDGVPLDQWPQKAIDYAIDDAVWARRVYLEQAKPQSLPEGELVDADGVVTNEKLQVGADFALHLMACHGVYTDPVAVEQFRTNVTVLAEEADKAAVRGGFWKLNKCKQCDGTGVPADGNDLPYRGQTCAFCEGLPHDECVARGYYKSRAKHKEGRNMKRLYALVDHAYGGHPPKTDTGRVATDSDTLMGSDDPDLIAYAEGSSYRKLLETYVPIVERGTEVAITSGPNVLVRSGRTSWRDPNWQNPPQKGGFRRCVVPRRGKVFCSADYSSVELCTLAQACLDFFGYSVMADAINAGKDLHLWYGVRIYNADTGAGLSYEEAEAILADTSHPLRATLKDYRQRAKAANFGFPGGLGIHTFVQYAKGYGLKLDANQADELKRLWLDAWPEMTDYFNMMSEAANIGERFTIKQLRSGRLRGGCSYTSGANTIFQGLAADGAKIAMWELMKACYTEPDSVLFGVRPVMFIHDEFIFEGDAETAHEWAHEASRIMVEAMKMVVPDVDIKAEPALMERWLKEAEPAYNEEGRLIPWRPKEGE